ncbi:MAG TPA: PsbP-related protein [Candidatus Paceibacterota bacterium]
MITKRTKFMLLALVVVAVGAYAYLYWWSRTPDHGFFDNLPPVRIFSEQAADAVIGQRPDMQQPGAPAGEETPAAMTFRTYENTEYGFSFSYPDTWTATATELNEKTTVCMKVFEATGGCLATLTFEPESVNMSTDVALNALRAELRDGRINEGASRIAGEAATRLTVSGDAAATRALVFAHDRLVYTIQTAPGQEGAFDRMVSSFRFQD